MSKSFRRAVTFSDDEDSDAADAPQKASGPIILESLTTDDSGRSAETNAAVSPPPTKSMLIEKINGALSNDGYTDCKCAGLVGRTGLGALRLRVLGLMRCEMWEAENATRSVLKRLLERERRHLERHP